MKSHCKRSISIFCSLWPPNRERGEVPLAATEEPNTRQRHAHANSQSEVKDIYQHRQQSEKQTANEANEREQAAAGFGLHPCQGTPRCHPKREASEERNFKSLSRDQLNPECPFMLFKSYGKLISLAFFCLVLF